MKALIAQLVIILGFNSLAVCQLVPALGRSSERGEPFELVRPTAVVQIGATDWASGGAGVAERGSLTAPLSNPAALFTERPSLYFEFGKRSTITIPYNVQYDGQYIAPSYAVAEIPVGNYTVAAGYANRYNYYRYWSIPISTEDLPEGTGRPMEDEYKDKIHSFFASMSMPVGEQIVIGGTTGLSYCTVDDIALSIPGSGHGTGFFLGLGALVHPSQKLTLGGSFQYSTPIDLNVSYGLIQNLIPVDSGRNVTRYAINTFQYTAHMPWTLEGGVNWQIIPRLSLLASLDYQHWSSLNDSYKNPLYVHVGTVITATSDLRFRFGFFTLPDPVTESTNQDFLTAGVQLISKPVTISFTILDSHLFHDASAVWYADSQEQFHQMYISAGVGYTF